MRSASGLTLAEVMVASAIASVVGGVAITIYCSQQRIAADLRQRSGIVANPAETQAAVAARHLVQHLEQADRVRILSHVASIQVRMPRKGVDFSDPASLDNPRNYQWDQYVWNNQARELRYYLDAGRLGCGNQNKRVLAKEIVSMGINFVDAEPLAPPGGDPFAPSPLDNNVLGYTIQWRSPEGRSQVFTGTVTLRGAAYSNVNAGEGDSGTGLTSPTVSAPPPTICS